MTDLPSAPRSEVEDGTGIEWRLVRGVVQHRFAAECFGPDGKPGPWIDTPNVDRIVHPARVAAIVLARSLATGKGEGQDA